MYLLAMDCAGSTCSVALFRDRDPVSMRHEVMSRGQAERLVPMIGEVLSDGNIAAAQLDRLAVTVGPGAFTGIRIGLACARSMSLALKIPATGISTFDATMNAFLSTEADGLKWPVAAVLETKRKDYYAKLFGADGHQITEGAALNGEALRDLLNTHGDGGCVLIGDGAKRFQAMDADPSATADLRSQSGFTASHVALCALAKDTEHALPPRPLYLRPPDVTVKPKS